MMGSKNNLGVKPRRRSGCSQDYSVRNEATCMTGRSMVTTALSWPVFQPLLLVPSSVHVQSKEPRRTDSWGSVSSHMLRQILAPDEWGGFQSPQGSPEAAQAGHQHPPLSACMSTQFTAQSLAWMPPPSGSCPWTFWHNHPHVLLGDPDLSWCSALRLSEMNSIISGGCREKEEGREIRRKANGNGTKPFLNTVWDSQTPWQIQLWKTKRLAPQFGTPVANEGSVWTNLWLFFFFT